MRIMICGSMTFSKEMVEAKKKLESLGHTIALPCDIDTHLQDEGFIDDLEKDYLHCVENNVMKKCMDFIAESEAVLVLNYPKNGIDGYIGTSSLMEIGLAYYLGKRIFLLHEPPHPTKARWAHEVKIIKPTVINSDFERIR